MSGFFFFSSYLLQKNHEPVCTRAKDTISAHLQILWKSSIGTLDLVRPFSGCMEIAGYALSRFPSPFRAGGKEANMRTPYVKEFAYDLWTTEDGRCWARIRATGDVAEISKEVMQELRREEKALIRRKQKPSENAGREALLSYYIERPLSLDEKEEQFESSDMTSWSSFADDLEETVIAAEIQRMLIQSLTSRQRDCYFCCVIQGESKYDYARRNGLSAQRVSTIFSQIQQKLKKLTCPC